jgi:hypothetical protein
VLSRTGVAADEKHELTSEPSSDFPVPFFRSLAGSGAARIVASSSDCRLLDAFDIGDSGSLKARGWSVQNMSRISTLSSTFTDGYERTAELASHLNRASWGLEVPEGCTGLVLRKVYDRFHGRQRARVLVDEEFKGYWYEPYQDRRHRWGVTDFGLVLNPAQSGRAVQIAVDPPPGTPLWSISRYEMYGLFDGTLQRLAAESPEV